MIVKVNGLKVIEKEMCVEMQGKSEKGTITASILLYVSEEDMKNYKIGDFFNVEFGRML